MRFAFHFVDSGAGWDAYDIALMRSIVRLPGRRHFLITNGNLRPTAFGPTGNQATRNAKRFVGSVWSTIPPDRFVELVRAFTPYVLLVEGMPWSHALQTADDLTSTTEDFVGVIAPQFRKPLHWVVYGSSLLNSYRVVDSELRLQHGSLELEGEDVRDHFALERWQNTRIFDSVVWEDRGVRSTIFDVFDTPEHMSIVGETEELLGVLMESIGNEALLHARDLDPHLVEALHAALHGLANARTAEQLAQSALSCRRFLERLADRLFPPIQEEREGRRLGPAEWRNRLWAYAEDALGSTGASSIDARLGDIGKRIDDVAAAAHSGLHRPDVERITVTRLVVALVSLTYDISLLRPPPHALPGDAYEPHASEIIRGLLKRNQSD